jgi:hypothetical protein
VWVAHFYGSSLFFDSTGIATSVAITMFAGNEDDLATAVSVPLFYGMVEAVMLGCFCLFCWKMGWTKAPANENLCVVLYNSYEVEEQELQEHEEAIEVVLAPEDMLDPSKQSHYPNDLIFARSEDGTYIVDRETLDKLHLHDGGEDPTDDTYISDRSVEHRRIVMSLSSDESSLRPPSSPTGSSSSGSIEPQDVATIILDMEDGEQRLRRGGRLGRTISTIRARATGYQHADVSSSRTPHSGTDPLEITTSNGEEPSYCVLPVETPEVVRRLSVDLV